MPSLFFSMSDVALATVALAIAGALGLLIGNIHYRGVGLGIGGVLFAGIAVGHLSGMAGITYSHETMEFVREFGLILFVFTIGIQVGPGFFATLQSSGLSLNLAAASIVLLGVAVTVALHFLLQIPVPVLVGLMSGAVTNTPGLGAATQALKDVGADPATVELPSLGYAVAYPFGILGILAAMLLVRGVLRISLPEEAKAFDIARRAGVASLPVMNVVVKNSNLAGLKLSEVPDLFDSGVVASRMMKNGELIVPARDTVVDLGDVLHLVGPAEKLRAMQIILGEEVKMALTTKGTALTWTRIVVTDTKILGRKLRALGLSEAHGINISRIYRAGVELPALADSTLQFGDILTVVGPPEGIEAVRGVFGDQKRRLDEVQFTAVFIGIALGVLFGSIPFMVPGLPAPIKLGLAGGPLIVAIVLSRLGHFGPFVWFMPPVANHALRELGIVLFLAVVGIKAGDKFLTTLLHGDGLMWMAYGTLITLIPLLVVGFVARIVFKFNYLSLCGVLAGSMTDPPALAFASGMSSSPAAPIGYAAVYPLVMCMRILAPQIIVLLLM
ncbi:putative transporter [Rhodobacteraceae bacterium DSL-40]|uniref:putative transporter n=1 Tax=Amaricoccus sp. B4 TaxID=3368557 RepID=UPI000DAF46D1